MNPAEFHALHDVIRIVQQFTALTSARVRLVGIHLDLKGYPCMILGAFVCRTVTIRLTIRLPYHYTGILGSMLVIPSGNVRFGMENAHSVIKLIEYQILDIDHSLITSFAIFSADATMYALAFMRPFLG
jgi:hypothetical protein